MLAVMMPVTCDNLFCLLGITVRYFRVPEGKVQVRFSAMFGFYPIGNVKTAARG
jgi:hypothetical protein